MLTFDKYSGVVTYDLHTYKLTRREMALLLILHKYLGANVSRSTIMSNLYQFNEREPDIKILDVMVHRIRKKLAGTGITVRTIQSYGFKLTIDIPDKAKIIGGIE